jgi:hypothetical protein
MKRLLLAALLLFAAASAQAAPCTKTWATAPTTEALLGVDLNACVLSNEQAVAEVDFTGILTVTNFTIANLAHTGQSLGEWLEGIDSAFSDYLALADIASFADWVALVGVTGTPDGTKFLRDDGTFQAIAGGGDALVANPLSQFAATTSLQLKGVISDETGSGALAFATSPTLVTPVLGVATATSITTGACVLDTNGVTCSAGAAGGFFRMYETAGNGGSYVEHRVPDATNLAGNTTHNVDVNGRYDPATLLQAKASTRKVSIPVVADSTGAVAHVDLRAFFSVADAVTLVRVSCWSGQANGFTIDVVERTEATPTTGTTGSLTAPLACDSDSAASTSFADAAVDADDYLFLDLTAESLAAGEFGGVTIEYTVN